MIESLDSPDSAFDWVFMLQADDWPLFERIWSQRPSLWREAFAYVLIDGPVVQAQRILRLALADGEFSVACQAAISLCHQMLEYPDEAPFDRSLLPRLREIRKAADTRDMREVDALFSKYASAADFADKTMRRAGKQDGNEKLMTVPPTFLQHRGVSLFHITKDGRDLEFWYSLVPGRDESDILDPESQQMDFDVRELARELHMKLDEASHADVLRAAVDRGIIKARRVFQL